MAHHAHIEFRNVTVRYGSDIALDGLDFKVQKNSIYGIVRAVQSGLGIGALPDYMSREVGNLVHVLPEIRGPSIDTYFVYPEELRNSKRICVLRDFLIDEIAADDL